MVKHTGIKLAYSGIFMFSLLALPCAYAELDPDALLQSVPASRAPQVSKKQAAAGMAEFAGIDAKDFRLRQSLSGQLPEVADDVPVVKHLRGEGGIPFATQEAANQRARKELQLWLKDPKNQKKINKPLDPPGTRMSPSQYALKPCKASRTVRKDSGFSGRPEKGKEIQFDYLFVHADDIGNLRSERHELFGNKTSVRIIGAGYAGTAAAARGFGVECLPTRVRATRATVFRHTGSEALKNFDQDQHGTGKLHELLADTAKRYR